MGAAYERWVSILAAERLPAAIVDLDAVDHNLAVLLAAAGDSPATVRVASKSIRVPAVMRHLLDRGGSRLRGLMTYSAHEATLLADRGFDDLLMGYPCARPDEAAALAALAARGVRVTAMVDGREHVELCAAAARAAGTTLPLCVDVDASWRPLSGRLHLGVRRSPNRDAAAAVGLGAVIAETDGVELTAVMAYEAQVAGLPDVNPFSRHLDPVRRVVKRRSIPVVHARRAAVVGALRAAGHAVALVNGGGTGSVATTAADPSVTEVTAGSGFFCPTLFDGYHGYDLRPAAFFALAVARHSDPDHITCAGGGYIASGPPGLDRQPAVHLPAGLETLAGEGFGEVQTPLRVRSGPAPAVGAPVICRHAKGGELGERFAEVLLVRGDAIVDRAPTYRGLGACFF